MAQPTWRPIKELDVPAQEGMAWTCALDYVGSGRILKIEVPKGTWNPHEFSTGMGPDGELSPTREAKTPVLSTAPMGSLIGRIGSSSARAGASDFLFLVGRHCVVTVPADKSGALYLGVNDSEPLMTSLHGQLHVTIYEAL